MPKTPPAPTYPTQPPGMQGSSFKLYTPAEAKVFPRLIVGVKGLEGSGKSNFGLGAPRLKQAGTQEGMYHFHTDLGLEGVGHKFLTYKHPGPIYKAEYVLDVRELRDASEDEIKKAAAPLARQFWKDFEVAAAKNVRSMVFDNASELYELDRLAEWGKLSMKAHHYTPINARWKRLFKLLLMGKSNAVILQRLVDEWKDDKPTGNYRPQGYTKTGFEVQEYVTAWRDTAHKFHLTIDKSRHDADLMGTDLEGDQCTFSFLAQQVFPDTDESFWR